VNFLHRDMRVLQGGAAKERQEGDDVESDIESNKGVVLALLVLTPLTIGDW
jgi:hypothetical protein